MVRTDAFVSTDFLGSIAKKVRNLPHLNNSLILHVPDIYIETENCNPWARVDMEFDFQCSTRSKRVRYQELNTIATP